MKILILQLARLGDIYTTWPFVRALKRQHPGAEIHMLVRSSFESATTGLEELDRVIALPVRDILEPLVNERNDVDASVAKLEQTLDLLEVEQYTKIYNLSFSSLSSYITDFLTEDGVEVLGYTRHSDGYFNPNDEVSAYFYAQVGVDRSSRVHLADIFASYLQIPYIEKDWNAPNIQTNKQLPKPYVVFHIGASEDHKKLTSTQWSKAIQFFLDKKTDMKVVLIGASHERLLSNSIEGSCEVGRLVNLVGDTSISELFPIIKNASLMVGCDSAPIHIASLTDTPTLNVSMGNVNFWETGPKATLGYIYRLTSEMQMVPQNIGEAAGEIVSGRVPEGMIVRARGLCSYSAVTTPQEQFSWKLTEAIYLSGDYPILDDYKIFQALQDIREVNSLILDNVRAMSPDSGDIRAGLVDRGEKILQHISQNVPAVSPLVRWVAAEKVRIPPGSFEVIKERTFSIHTALAAVLNNYVPQEEVRGNHGQIQG